MKVIASHTIVYLAGLVTFILIEQPHGGHRQLDESSPCSPSFSSFALLVRDSLASLPQPYALIIGVAIVSLLGTALCWCLIGRSSGSSRQEDVDGLPLRKKPGGSSWRSAATISRFATPGSAKGSASVRRGDQLVRDRARELADRRGYGLLGRHVDDAEDEEAWRTPPPQPKTRWPEEEEQRAARSAEAKAAIVGLVGGGERLSAPTELAASPYACEWDPHAIVTEAAAAGVPSAARALMISPEVGAAVNAEIGAACSVMLERQAALGAQLIREVRQSREEALQKPQPQPPQLHQPQQPAPPQPMPQSTTPGSATRKPPPPPPKPPPPPPGPKPQPASTKDSKLPTPMRSRISSSEDFASRPKLHRSPTRESPDPEASERGPTPTRSAEAETATANTATAAAAAAAQSGWSAAGGGGPWWAAEPRPDSKHRRTNSDGAGGGGSGGGGSGGGRGGGGGLSSINASFSSLRPQQGAAASETAAQQQRNSGGGRCSGGPRPSREGNLTSRSGSFDGGNMKGSDTISPEKSFSMADWHKMIRLQPGAPVLYQGLRGIVRRSNPVRESYAIHLPDEQRTVDVPFGDADLRADVTSSPVAPSGAQQPTSQTAGPGCSRRNSPPLPGAASGDRKSPRPSQCFSSSRMMM